MRLLSIVISGIVAITRWWEWPIIIWREPRRRAGGTTRARGVRLLGRGRGWRINTTQKSTRWARIWKFRHGFHVRFLLDHSFWNFRTINNRIPQMYIFYFEKNRCLWIHLSMLESTQKPQLNTIFAWVRYQERIGYLQANPFCETFIATTILFKTYLRRQMLEIAFSELFLNSAVLRH